MKTKRSHFGNLSVVEHLRKARNKGKAATSELHAVEVPGHISAGADSAKEAAISTLLIYIVARLLYLPMNQISIILAVYITGIFFWKVGRSSHLAWSRLERINSLVQEEKHEIETNREEEREELTEMYQAKGFEGPLLTKIIDVLMADDNKLLAVMLEEELGVPMEAYVHPIKQALGAAVGVLITALSLPIAIAISKDFGLITSTFLITGIASLLMAKIEKIDALKYTIKGLSITFLAVYATYFFSKFLIHELL